MSAEKNPNLTLNLQDGRKLEITPDNSMLYTFLGRTVVGDLSIDNSSINHIWVKTGVNDQGQPLGMYFFEEFSPVYEEVSEHMHLHDYPMSLNQRQVPECDIRAWLGRIDIESERFATQIPDSMPRGFV